MNKGIYDEVWGEIVDGEEDTDEEEKKLHPYDSRSSFLSNVSFTTADESKDKPGGKKHLCIKAIGV